jgi:enoyl-[acyl-carrier-protein] reductase (NADH)
VKRVVSPTRSSEDIAGPALLLASDLSLYVTGHIIMADGGCRTVCLSRAPRAKVMAKEKASVRTSMLSRSV